MWADRSETARASRGCGASGFGRLALMLSLGAIPQLRRRCVRYERDTYTETRHLEEKVRLPSEICFPYVRMYTAILQRSSGWSKKAKRILQRGFPKIRLLIPRQRDYI